jgi:hypothetical protein
VIEEIVSRFVGVDGTVLYEVSWADTDMTPAELKPLRKGASSVIRRENGLRRVSWFNTWEPPEHLDRCDDVLAAFEALLASKKA